MLLCSTLARLALTTRKVPLPTSSLSGKLTASMTSPDPALELALLSAGVRRCMPAAVAVVTQ